MKRFLFVALAVLGMQSAACGGPLEADEALVETPTESNVTAMAFCTAGCPDGSSVSCSGAYCEAVEGQAVMCNGNWISCPPYVSTVSIFCESINDRISCTGTNATVLGAPNNKVCGGVACGDQEIYCPPFTDDRECY
jgi:hypothetical protein